MRSLATVIGFAVTMALATPVVAGPIMSRPVTVRPPSPVRISPPVRPTTRTTPPRTTTTTRVRTSPFTYNGRQYTPAYTNGHLWLLYWVVLNNGTRQEQRADCDRPRTTQERNACAEARRRT